MLAAPVQKLSMDFYEASSQSSLALGHSAIKNNGELFSSHTITSFHFSLFFFPFSIYPLFSFSLLHATPRKPLLWLNYDSLLLYD